jgi:hypothetical protein
MIRAAAATSHDHRRRRHSPSHPQTLHGRTARKLCGWCLMFRGVGRIEGMSEARIPRRRFMTFGLRAILLWIAAVSVGFAFLRRHWELKTTRRKLALELEKTGGGVISDPDGAPESLLAAADPGTLQRPSSHFPISWLRRLLGDDSAYCIIIWNGTLSESRDRGIVEAFPEAIIWRVQPGEDTPGILQWIRDLKVPLPQPLNAVGRDSRCRRCSWWWGCLRSR